MKNSQRPKAAMAFENRRVFAEELDRLDPLAHYRDAFHFPQYNGGPMRYFTGNSLGLQPKRTEDYVHQVMNDWATLGVEGHFTGDRPWWDYHERLSQPLSTIVGALPSEVGVMNSLTVNLHLLMVSFYRPTATRFKILCEEKAFPSDQYLIASQLRFHGYRQEEALVTVNKRIGEHHFRTEDILEAIHKMGDSCALVFLGGVNYYNGQVLDMKTITAAGRAAGAHVGWDLAHAAGNVALKLHDWEVDFAAWCSYKYMNSGPGHAAGYFVHERHHGQNKIPRFEGWWGHDKSRRFLMETEFSPEPDALAWQLSNAPILSLAPYLASLELFDQVGMPALISKRIQLVAYLEFILLDVAAQTQGHFEIITPSDPQQRGAQLSVLLHGQGRSLFEFLTQHGASVDWREPNVIRLAPAPFYCSFVDVYEFGKLLSKGIMFHAGRK